MKVFKLAIDFANKKMQVCLIVTLLVNVFALSYIQAKLKQKSIENTVERFIRNEAKSISVLGGELLLQSFLTKLADGEREDGVTVFDVLIMDNFGKPIAATSAKNLFISIPVGEKVFSIDFPDGKKFLVLIKSYWSFLNHELMLLLFIDAAAVLFLYLMLKHYLSILIRSFNDDLVNVKSKLNDAHTEFESGIFLNKKYNFNFSDFYFIKEDISNLFEFLVKLKLDSINSAYLKGFEKLSQQVSHDIRSPLAALEMFAEVAKELPEEKRIILRNSVARIKDIANALISSKKQDYSIKIGDESDVSASLRSENTQNLLLYPILESIISEKRLQFRNAINTEIVFIQTKDSYGLFSLVQPNELKRVISNLVNNAVESFVSAQNGTVRISLSSSLNGYLSISIIDNGRGIPINIQSKLGERGFTYQKDNGSGLGLHHAFDVIKTWGGDLKIHSDGKSGTEAQLLLKKSNPPDWFVDRIVLKNNAKVIVFDDDHSVHQIWKGRLDSIYSNDVKIELLHFTIPADFRKFYQQNFSDLGNALFLMDYEISNFSETGLDIIEQLGISEQSILVTSRYEEAAIRDRCEQLGVKLIPKPMSGFVPIEVST